MSYGNLMFYGGRCRLLYYLSVLAVALGAAASAFGYSHTTRYNDNVSATASGTVTVVSYNAAAHTYTLRLELSSVTGGGEPGWYGLGQIGIDGHTLSAYSGNPLPSPVVWTTADGQTLTGSVSSACFNGGMSWASSGTDFTLNLPVGGTERKKVTISIRNDKEYDVTYKLIQDGQEVGSYTLHPGEALIQQTEVDADTDVQVVAQISDLAYSDGQWEVVDGAVHSQTVGTVTPSNTGTTVSIPTPDTPQAMPATSPAPGSGSQTGSIVWKSGGGASVPEDLLTKAVYKEGVENITKRIDKSNESLKKIEDQAAKSEQIPTESALTTQLESMKAGAQGKVDTEFAKLNDVLPSSAGAVNVTSSSSNWPTFEIDGYGRVDTDPRLSAPWLYPALNVCREILLWLMVYFFIKYSVEKVNEYALAVAVTPSTQTSVAAQDMIPVGGQLLSWLKGSLTAALVITVVVAVYGVGIGLVNTRLGLVFSGGVKSFVETPLVMASSLLANPVTELVMQFFPMGAFFALMVAEMFLLTLMGPAFIGASLVVRAIRL